MKNTEIALLLDAKFDLFDINPGSTHVSSGDCSTIKIQKNNEYVGSLTPFTGGWIFNPASVGTFGHTYSLNLEAISEITEILKYLNENYLNRKKSN